LDSLSANWFKLTGVRGANKTKDLMALLYRKTALLYRRILLTLPPEWEDSQMKSLDFGPEAPMGLKPRVLIADDHRQFLTVASDLLRSRFEIVAEVMNGRAALEAAAKLDPDLVLLDIAMPELNGIEAATELRRSGSRAKIVFLTSHRGDEFISAAFVAGALGFVYKSRSRTDLIPALDHALAGYRFVSPQ
jgi:CheY-like chemotaxis protein